MIVSPEKMAANIEQHLIKQGTQIDQSALIELRDCCSIFLELTDIEKVHDKQLKEGVATLSSIVSDLSWTGIDSKSVVLSFWREVMVLVSPIGRELLTIAAKTAFDVAIKNFKS